MPVFTPCLTPRPTLRLTLRPFVLDDAAFIVELVNDPGWLRHIGDRQVRSIDDARQYLTNGALAHAAKHGFSLAMVELRGSATPIGMCGLIRRDTLPDVDIGYALLPAYRGQGYAQEAATAWLAYGFGELDLPRIVAITTEDNAASGRVLGRLGMHLQQRLQLPGSEEFSLLYSIERSTWLRVQQRP